MAGLSIQRISKHFGAAKALDDVSIEVADGEFLAVLGPSGCGKTTLLRMIAGFEDVSGGSIEIGGVEVSSLESSLPPEKRRVGIVFQNYALWPHMTVAENIGYALKVARVRRAERDKRVADALALVDMQQYGDRRPANLSGGQRQRVALARCLVAEPRLVLFDEPLANLDVHLRASMEDEFAKFHKRTGTTIVYITHDQAEAMALADRIAVMDQGRLMQLATPHELYHEPVNEMVASFISQGMVLPAEVLTAESGGQCRVRLLGHELDVRCRAGEQPDPNAKICIRRSQIAAADADEPGFDGTVVKAIYRGGASRIEFEPDALPGTRLHFDEADPVRCETGQRLRLKLTNGWLIPEREAAGC
ncbi:ABC transporter ATP-binding protein [Pseudohoeflea coraliihabitans]|uniref:ABC transporter ATP-binding protein n=1 Tax=Pseudohoeflea coraliihabitans TaxID=2860393 RepID=A0ABS6WL46_9HYPH|nr:ABC transporter ATP-binding protein [Pseudohoeflea sp. DP4N28-3]MBW3096681.1 ABC transporter ATP-binding protein [Pseudohoeflea sp. DP4N28-3]